MADDISIAPRVDEVYVDTENNKVWTDWNGGVAYQFQPDVLEKFKEQYIRVAFCSAIAFSSKPHQLERLLNIHFNTEGKVTSK